MGVLICPRLMKLVFSVGMTRVSPAFYSLQGGAESQFLTHQVSHFLSIHRHSGTQHTFCSEHVVSTGFVPS